MNSNNDDNNDIRVATMQLFYRTVMTTYSPLLYIHIKTYTGEILGE